jgi:biopolymer transport protein ExbD
MHLQRPRPSAAPVIPTASMADIAFLLIIFFMVTTAYSLDRTPIELPQTREQQQVPKSAAIVAITREGSLRFSAGEKDTQPVADMATLGESIRQVAAANSLHPFIIKADRLTPYGLVDQVLELLRLARAEQVSLLSEGEKQP